MQYGIFKYFILLLISYLKEVEKKNVFHTKIFNSIFLCKLKCLLECFH